MFCGNCGKKLIDGSLFCMECGTPVPVGQLSGTPAAQPSAFSGKSGGNNGNSYNAPNEADLFGTNSFSEEAISAFSGAMNAFGAQGFQVPTVEDVDLATGRVRQKAPKNKGDDILVENFSMTDGTADTEYIEDRLPVVEGCSMDEDESKNVILDPYRFLGDSMEEMSMDKGEAEMPVAQIKSVSAVEPVSVQPLSFDASVGESFASLAAEPDIQPSVDAEPVFSQPPQSNSESDVKEKQPVVEQVSVSVVEQVAVAVAHEGAVPVVEPITQSVIEKAAESAAEPVVEKQAEPVAEKQAEPVAEKQAEPVIEKQAEPVVEKQAEPVAEKQAEPVAEKQAEPVVEKQVEPVIEKQAEPVVEQEETPVIEEIPVIAQVDDPAEPVVNQPSQPIQQPQSPQSIQPQAPIQQPITQPQQSQPTVRQTPEQPPQNNYEPMPPAEKKKGVPIWLFILVLLGLVAAVVIILLNMNK